MEEKKVSILICTYNSGEYIKNTLLSVLEQSYKNIEILIFDNNSKDGTVEFLKKIEKKEKKISVVYSQKNIGAYAGLNELLKIAVGDFIAIQDHDDLWNPEKIQKQVEFLEQNPEYIGCGTSCIMYYEEDKKYFEYYLDQVNYYTIHPSILFRKNKLFFYDFSQTEYMCDAWSIKKNLCRNEKKIYNLTENLTLHLVKKGSSNYSYKWFKVSLNNIQRIFDLHPGLYGCKVLVWEILRKILYPTLNYFHQDSLIQQLERIPFILSGNTIKITQKTDWWSKYF